MCVKFYMFTLYICCVWEKKILIRKFYGVSKMKYDLCKDIFIIYVLFYENMIVSLQGASFAFYWYNFINIKINNNKSQHKIIAKFIWDEEYT